MPINADQRSYQIAVCNVLSIKGFSLKTLINMIKSTLQVINIHLQCLSLTTNLHMYIYTYPLKQFLKSNLFRQYGCNQHEKREEKGRS